MGAGSIWEISVSSTQFCCEPKTALKNSLLEEKRRERERDLMAMIHRSKKQPETERVCRQEAVKPSQGGLGKAQRDMEFA